MTDEPTKEPTDEAPSPPTAPSRDELLDYARLFGRQLGLVADMYLAVVGASLVALGLVVLLAAFDVVDVALSGSVGGLLGSGLVIVVVGLFAFGVSSEGPISRAALDWPELPLAIARALAIVAVAVVGLLGAGFLEGPAGSIGYVFELAVLSLRVVSRAALLFALPLGVGGAWLVRWRWPGSRIGWDRLVLLGVWIFGSWVVLAATL